MSHHDAYGLDVSDLDIAVVDSSREMQKMLRSMLSAFSIRRIRTYDSAPDALTSMLPDPPSVVFTAWNMSPMTGEQLVRAMRDTTFPSLCRVPVIAATSNVTLSVVDRAFSAGANALLAKPMSSQVLLDRLEWLVRDDTQMLEEDGHMVVEGIQDVLETRVRNSPLASAIERARALEDIVRDATNRQAAPQEVGNDLEIEEQAAAEEQADAAPRKPVPAKRPKVTVRKPTQKKDADRRWFAWKLGKGESGGKGETGQRAARSA